jgi:modulator of FtsH protease HflC
MPDVLQETYDRMSAERLAEAALLRAVGESQSIKVRAEADREYVELVATARRESEIIRGEGDAERNKVFAEAYSKDAEFFSFYRSMQAYAKSLGGAATTFVLDPTWDFLKYFGRGAKDEVPRLISLTSSVSCGLPLDPPAGPVNDRLCIADHVIISLCLDAGEFVQSRIDPVLVNDSNPIQSQNLFSRTFPSTADDRYSDQHNGYE